MYQSFLTWREIQEDDMMSIHVTSPNSSIPIHYGIGMDMTYHVIRRALTPASAEPCCIEARCAWTHGYVQLPWTHLFVIVKLRVCWCHFIKHATEGISPLCHHQSCIKLLLNLQFNEKSKTWKIIKSKCLEVSEYQEISSMFKSLYYNSSIVRQNLPKVHLTSPYISSLLPDPFIAMPLDH